MNGRVTYQRVILWKDGIETEHFRRRDRAAPVRRGHVAAGRGVVHRDLLTNRVKAEEGARPVGVHRTHAQHHLDLQQGSQRGQTGITRGSSNANWMLRWYPGTKQSTHIDTGIAAWVCQQVPTWIVSICTTSYPSRLRWPNNHCIGVSGPQAEKLYVVLCYLPGGATGPCSKINNANCHCSRYVILWFSIMSLFFLNTGT